MSFANVEPPFSCLVSDDHPNVSVQTTALCDTNQTFCQWEQMTKDDSSNTCDINGTACTAFKFYGLENTIVSEWNLVCDQKSFKNVITSVQMVGVLMGSLLSGQIAGILGRKKILYSFILVHIILNFLAIFSNSWVLFAIMRCLIGICIGAIMIVVYVYPIEFLPTKWRPILSITPTWQFGVCLFALASYLIKDWYFLHLACAVLSIPSLFGWFYVPESIRWLATKGKLKEAHDVFVRMAKINKMPLPEDTMSILENISRKERKIRELNSNYTYLDVFRGWKVARTTLINTYFWFCCGFSYYAISFGVGNLFGNLYMNIFLLAVIEFPILITTFFLNNHIGRRPTTMFFFLMSSIPPFSCILAHYLIEGESRGLFIRIMSIFTKMMIGSVWACAETWGTESYPTVTRNLGSGFFTIGSRLGSIISPFLDLGDHVVLSYSSIGIMSLTCVFLSLFLEETKGKGLNDNVEEDSEIHSCNNDLIIGVDSLQNEENIDLNQV